MPRERIIVHITITLFNKYLISMTTCVTVLVLLFFTVAHLCGLGLRLSVTEGLNDLHK